MVRQSHGLMLPSGGQVVHYRQISTSKCFTLAQEKCVIIELLLLLLLSHFSRVQLCATP